MRWYKTASMTVSVGEYRPPEVARTIYELSSKIQSKLWPILEQMPPELMERWKAHRPMELFTIDGVTDMDEPQGVLNFYCTGISQPYLDKMIAAIKYFAKEFGGEVDGPTAQETIGQTLQRQQAEGNGINEDWAVRMKDAMNEIRVMRFNGKILPASNDVEFAPELNLANNNAMFIFREVLGFPPEMLDAGGFSLDARDLLIRVGQAKTKYNMQEKLQAENLQREMESAPQQGGAQIISGQYDMQGLEGRLVQIENIANWAIRNNFSRIDVF